LGKVKEKIRRESVVLNYSIGRASVFFPQASQGKYGVRKQSGNKIFYPKGVNTAS